MVHHKKIMALFETIEEKKDIDQNIFIAAPKNV